MSVTIAETGDIAACHSVRHAVFVQEQGIALADDLDGRDEAAVQLIAVEDGTPVGTARVLIDGDIGKIGRVAVLKDRRGTGLGKALVEAAVDALVRRGVKCAKLGAQTTALEFYEALGFTASGPVYDDAGLPHRDMIRDL